MITEQELHKIISDTLRANKIDDLAIEMVLTANVMSAINPYVKKTSEETKEEIIEAHKTGIASYEVKNMIREKIVSNLNLNPGGKDGVDFIEFAYTRLSKHDENINTFIDWWLRNGGEPKFWSFNRMKTMWPQAFAKNKFARYITPTDEKRWERSDFVPAPNSRDTT